MHLLKEWYLDYKQISTHTSTTWHYKMLVSSPLNSLCPQPSRQEALNVELLQTTVFWMFSSREHHCSAGLWPWNIVVPVNWDSEHRNVAWAGYRKEPFIEGLHLRFPPNYKVPSTAPGGPLESQTLQKYTSHFPGKQPPTIPPESLLHWVLSTYILFILVKWCFHMLIYLLAVCDQNI